LCSATAIAYKVHKCWLFNKTISEFWVYLHCACAEMPIYELPVKNLMLPFVSATPISCNRKINLLSEYMFAIFWRFL